DYAVGDVQVLLQVHRAFVNHFRILQQEALGMGGDDLWTAANIPMTGGALVAKTLERFIYRQAQHPDELRFCPRTQGLLDPGHRRYPGYLAAYRNCITWYRSPADLREALANVGRVDDSGFTQGHDLRLFFEAKFLHTALDACSVRWWADIPPTNTACFNAAVAGGRCHNENPYAFRIGRGLDADIAGCYGEALRQAALPGGLPTVWSYAPNQARLTLGQWLDRHEEQLVPGLWTATVSGRLPFEQDLIQSKLLKANE